MNITATHINYLMVCHRKLWLFSNGIQMEHSSDLVAEGNLIHEYSYSDRASKYTELEFEGIKIDYYDPVNKTIHEIKKTNKLEAAHEWQVKYYIYILNQHGIDNVKGVLEYPKLRQRTEVFFSPEDDDKIKAMLNEIENITQQPECPPLSRKTICKKCSYYDFCWIDEKMNDA